MVRIDVVGDVYDLASFSSIDKPYQLIIADPPYGNIVTDNWEHKGTDVELADQLITWCSNLEKFSHPGATLYMWGGYGTPGNRAFYRFVIGLEERTNWRMAAHITWSKRRAYGTSWNYLSTREECAYCVLGDVKKPRVFNVPLLSTERGYAGFNKDHPAKSPFYRRTMVWTDINEIFRGKKHQCEKKPDLSRIMINTSSNPGDLVLDAFSGSRNCAEEADRLGRDVISVDVDTVEHLDYQKQQSET